MNLNSKFEKNQHVIYRKKGKYYVVKILGKLFDHHTRSWSYSFEYYRNGNLINVETLEKKLRKIENIK